MWILPTYKRPDRLKLTLQSLKDCNISTPGVVVIDGDNTGYDDAQKYLPKGWYLAEMEENVGYIKIIQLILQQFPSEPWYGWFTDDMIAETDKFDQKLLSQAISPNLIISSNDGWQAPKRIHGASIFEGQLYRFVMQNFPNIRHSCYDDIWESLGNDLNIWHTDMSIMARHVHPWKDGSLPDATYDHNYSTIDADIASYNEWKQFMYPRIVEELRRSIG